MALRKKSLKKAVLVTSVVLALTSIGYYYYTYFYSYSGLRRTVHLDSVPIAIETIAIFLFSFFYFYEQISDTENLFVYNQPSFWAVLGILIYLAGSFFVYISANSLTIKQLQEYWVITNIASIVKNIFFVIAIYLQASNMLKGNQFKKPSYSLNQF